MLLEAAVKNTMLQLLKENAQFYEKTLGMENNSFIEGKVFDCQKAPMRFYNGLVKADFLKTPVDFSNGGGIKTTEYGQGFFKTVKKYLFFRAKSTFDEIEQSFESMNDLYGKCEGVLIQYQLGKVQLQTVIHGDHFKQQARDDILGVQVHLQDDHSKIKYKYLSTDQRNVFILGALKFYGKYYYNHEKEVQGSCEC